MKAGDHKGHGGNSRRTDRKRNRYASSLDRRDRSLSKRIGRIDDALKSADDTAALHAERGALLVRLRKVERLSSRALRNIRHSAIALGAPDGDAQ